LIWTLGQLDSHLTQFAAKGELCRAIDLSPETAFIEELSSENRSASTSSKRACSEDHHGLKNNSEGY